MKGEGQVWSGGSQTSSHLLRTQHSELSTQHSVLRTRLTELPPLSIYIHIPWCLKKCPYCDFNSHEKRNEIPESDYVESLLRDLEYALPQIKNRPVHTIFFGGGTPSLFSVSGIEKILTRLRTCLPVVDDAEITLEANPGTFESEKFKGYREIGINRLSIGIQSFNSEHLTVLGRVHNSTESYRAIEIAQTYFDNFNLDLMYALPHQTLAQAEEDINKALQISPPHLSAYHLTLEPNTYFYQHPPKLPNDELAADMQLMIEQRLSENGYVHYETSAFAKSGNEAKHNLNYWQFGDYLGLGAGAHSKLSFPDRITREVRYKQPKEYMQNAMTAVPIQEKSTVTNEALPFEFMMNALRLTAGFEIKLFQQRTGLSVNSIESVLSQAEIKGLIERSELMIKPTLRGQRFLNDLLQLFLYE